VQDRGHDLGFIWLRQLLDLAALCRYHGTAVDWTAVWAAFARRRLAGVPTSRLYMAHRLLGLPLPSGFRPTGAARFHLWLCLAQLHWPRLLEINRLRATLTSPLNARVLDMVYGSGENRLRRFVDRLRHGLRMVNHHRGNLRAAIDRRRTKYQ
jgi:hypothetical protein